MATLQATIPFKSRKHTYLNSKNKSDVENQDILNTGRLLKVNKLKRHINDQKSDFRKDIDSGKSHANSL